MMGFWRQCTCTDRPRRLYFANRKGFHILISITQCCPLRHHRRRITQTLRTSIPSRSRAHAKRRRYPLQLCNQDCEHHAGLDDGLVSRRGHRETARGHRRGTGDFGALRRRRFVGRFRPHPQGYRRHAPLRLRRYRTTATGRSRTNHLSLSPALRHPSHHHQRLEMIPRLAAQCHRLGREEKKKKKKTP